MTDSRVQAEQIVDKWAADERVYLSDWQEEKLIDALASALAAAAREERQQLRGALERTTAMCRAATTWNPDDVQGLRYHALEAAKEGMTALASLPPQEETGR